MLVLRQRDKARQNVKRNPKQMDRLQIEKELEALKGNNEIKTLRRKLLLYRRLKDLPAVPPRAIRDPDCAYPV